VRISRATAATGLVAAVGLAIGPIAPAQAHPSGRTFLVNLYAGLAFAPGQVRATAVVNTAEVVTRQDRPTVDADHDGTVTATERSGYARSACADLATHLDVRVNGSPVRWAVTPGDYHYEHGSPGLPSARLTCGLAAPARLAEPSTVTIANRYRTDRTGWHELTAVGDGVRLVDSPLPRHSVTDELRTYPPEDALVLDVRAATVRVEPVPATEEPVPATEEPVPATEEPVPATEEPAVTTTAPGRDDPPATGAVWAALIIAAVGVGMLVNAVRHRAAAPPESPSSIRVDTGNKLG
jgi:hypothetical protein